MKGPTCYCDDLFEEYSYQISAVDSEESKRFLFNKFKEVVKCGYCLNKAGHGVPKYSIYYRDTRRFGFK